MDTRKIENIEIDLLLDAIFLRYGYDFKGYARSSINRRIKSLLKKSETSHLSEMIPMLLYDPLFFETFVRTLSITVTEMFRAPLAYRLIREKLVPFLRTYPSVRIWHAGCATGEEVYSMAILLKEESLLKQSTLFGTDLNDEALASARLGIYSLDNIKQYTANYQQAGGTGSFSEYYHARYNAIAISPSLKKNIIFANHNLVTDSVFSEVHMILCRNVLIYFKDKLKERVLKLFSDSLVHRGFLCLGDKETLRFTNLEDQFKVIDEKHRLYQKK